MSRLADAISLEDFRAEVERETLPSEYPGAMKIEKGIPIYDTRTVTPAIAPEWARIIGEGPGVFVVKGAFADTGAIDAASEMFRAIIAEERAAGVASGDHFAKAGANDRIWNSLQKLCLRAPDVYARYMANPVIDLACRAWLGPGYQIATQVNQVRPGGKAQAPHRDYHLGFMSADQMGEYPDHIHVTSPTLILQGGVAHVDMTEASGTTKLLPHSQRYKPGYIAATQPEFAAYFAANHLQLPLAKGDAIFFSSASGGTTMEAHSGRNTSMKKLVKSLLLGAAMATSAMTGAAHAEGEQFVWISHDPDSDSWFNVIKNTIKITSEQMGVTTEYRNPPTGDLADMARLVQQASAAGVDGIIVTIADYNVLEGPIKDAFAKGILVITVNSGTVEESQKLGALMHVGQPECEAGLGAGKRVKEAGVTSFVCVNHHITNPQSVERCRGYTDGIGVELGNQMIDSSMDPSEVQNTVKAYLTANPETNSILTLGPNSAEPQFAR
jgi:hypothetical protein